MSRERGSLGPGKCGRAGASHFPRKWAAFGKRHTHKALSCPDPEQSRHDEIKNTALVGVAQWIEGGTEKQRVTGSIPSQGSCLGCGPGPQ